MAKERKAKKAAQNKKSEKVDINELIAAQQELSDLKKQHGIEEKEGAVSKAISKGFDRRENRQKHLISKKTYIILLLLTGWIGGHRYYARRWILGPLYTLLFWTGVPIAMSLIDLLEVIPMEADENGRIEM